MPGVPATLPRHPPAPADADWIGFSVTIPHKQAALEGAQEVDPVAAQASGQLGRQGRRPNMAHTSPAGGPAPALSTHAGSCVALLALDTLLTCTAPHLLPQQIGAVNTLVRQDGGSLNGYNTDWSAAIAAIERGLDPGGSGAGWFDVQNGWVAVAGVADGMP